MANQKDKLVFIWEGAVGAKVELNKSGDFFMMTPLRQYKEVAPA